MPNNHRINIEGAYHAPFWFPFASVYVPVTPCVLDGSLSFLEMVWKLLKNLNDVNAATNANHTDILTLAGEINTIYGTLDGKLDFLEVTFDDTDDPISADKTFAEIAAAFNSKIVLGRCGSSFYVCLSESEARPAAYQFYSLDGLKLDILAINSLNVISRTTVNLITSAGGTITGALTVPAPTADGHAATKKYVDDQDAATLIAAKGYSDETFVKTTGDSGSTYATRSATEQSFTDIPSSPSTLTLNNLYAKLARWYVEISNRVTVADVVDSGGTLRCSKTFAVVKDMIDAGHEVIVHYDDGALSTLKTNVARVDTFNASKITFWCTGYTITLNSDESVTVTTN